MDAVKAKTSKILFYISVLIGITGTALDPIIPIISDKLKIGYGKIGLILLLGSIFALISTLISGRLCDKFEIKKIILAGMVISLIGLLLFGIYLSIVIFVLTIILFRTGYGTLDSSIKTFAFRLFNRRNSLIFLRLDLFWNIGAITSPLLISLVLFLKIDPKYAFIFFAVFYLIFIIIFYKVCPNKKSVFINFSDIFINDNKISKTENSVNLVDNLETENNKKINFFTIIKNPIIFITCLALFFHLGIMLGLSTWLTTYFTSLNIKVTFGSVILSFFWTFSAIGVFLTSKIVTRSNEIAILFFGTLLGTISTVIYCFTPIVYIKIIFLMLQAIFYQCVFPISIFIAVNENPKATGTIVGIMISAGISASIIIQPLIGYFTQYFGKEYIAYEILVIAVLGLIFVSVLVKLLNNKYKYKFNILKVRSKS